MGPVNTYDRMRKIGQGSYGSAFLCRCKEDGMRYVVKCIAVENLPQKERQDSLNEAKVLSQLHHPNIIAFKECYLADGYLHIVTHLADLGDLSRKIQEAKLRKRGFEEERIWSYFVQILLALKHMHDRKILHRDIKSANVFLATPAESANFPPGVEQVKLGDFGVSKTLEHTHEFAKTTIGTPYYMSPEICSNKEYNSKSDIWALGVLLYELCSLSNPFDGTDFKSLIVKILKGKYRPIPDIYSPDMAHIVSLLLNPSADQRPSCNALLAHPKIQERAQRFLPAPVFENEFSHTVLHREKFPYPPSSPDHGSDAPVSSPMGPPTAILFAAAIAAAGEAAAAAAPPPQSAPPPPVASNKPAPPSIPPPSIDVGKETPPAPILFSRRAAAPAPPPPVPIVSASNAEVLPSPVPQPSPSTRGPAPGVDVITGGQRRGSNHPFSGMLNNDAAVPARFDYAQPAAYNGWRAMMGEQAKEKEKNISPPTVLPRQWSANKAAPATSAAASPGGAVIGHQINNNNSNVIVQGNLMSNNNNNNNNNNVNNIAFRHPQPSTTTTTSSPPHHGVVLSPLPKASPLPNAPQPMPTRSPLPPAPPTSIAALQQKMFFDDTCLSCSSFSTSISASPSPPPPPSRPPPPPPSLKPAAPLASVKKQTSSSPPPPSTPDRGNNSNNNNNNHHMVSSSASAAETKRAADSPATVVKKGNSNINIKDDYSESDPSPAYCLSPPKFFLSGKTISFAGLKENDSIHTYIESLRLLLEEKLGSDIFVKKYRQILSAFNEENESLLEKIMTGGNASEREYLPVIMQLIASEDFAYVNNPVVARKMALVHL